MTVEKQVSLVAILLILMTCLSCPLFPMSQLRQDSGQHILCRRKVERIFFFNINLEVYLSTDNEEANPEWKVGYWICTDERHQSMAINFRKEVTSSENEWTETNSFCSTDMVSHNMTEERRLSRSVSPPSALRDIFVTQMLRKISHLTYKKGVFGKMRWWEVIQIGLHS